MSQQTRAALGEPRFTFTGFVKLPDGDYSETEYSLPAKFEVCPRCEGKGAHTNPSIDGNGITASEMDELGDDFREDYMSGAYDITCTTCQGARVVAVPDQSRWTADQKKAYRKYLQDEAASAREDASEAHLRRMEGGGW